MDDDNPVSRANALLRALLEPSDSQGTPPRSAYELGGLLAQDQTSSLAESYLLLVLDYAKEGSLSVRRSALVIVRLLLHPQHAALLPMLVEIVLATISEEGAGQGGVGWTALLGEAAAAAQTLLRPVLARILTQPPSGTLQRAWHNLQDVRRRLEERLLPEHGGVRSTPAFAAVLVFLASGVLVGTPCVRTPPQPPPPPPQRGRRWQGGSWRPGPGRAGPVGAGTGLWPGQDPHRPPHHSEGALQAGGRALRPHPHCPAAR